jgi:uncharacterized LabA/DUF88 family protein
MKKENNIAFIDAQNLHLWTQTENWKIDFKRFRIYLKDKFKINEAYFFLWFVDDEHQTMYRKIQKAGFILEFREHNSSMKGKKKWNVDVDIVYDIMHRLLEEDDFDKIVLVSWDWDYIKLVKYLIEKERLKKILFPNSKYSSLYKPFKDKYWMNLSQDRVKKVIKFKT